MTALAISGLAGCGIGGGGGGGDKGAFCDAVEEYAKARGSADSDEVAVGSGSDRLERAFATLVDKAPESFRDSLENIADVDPKTADEAALRQRSEVLSKVNTFVREGCELDDVTI